MAALDDLIAAKARITAALAANAGKPTYNLDGQSFSWAQLTDQLEAIDEAITRTQGPIELPMEFRP